MKDDKRQHLQAQVSELDSISTAPVILQPLLQMLRQPADEISIDRIVELVSFDGVIAAQCLRAANSALFARCPVETTRSAVMALGIDKVRSILFGVCMNRTIPKDKWVLEANAFWRHSLGCALVAQCMARGIGYPEPEKAYLAGLLHDLGFLVNSVLYTSKFRECVEYASSDHSPLHNAEERILGFTHADSGSMLCEHWGLSRELSEAAGCHHDLERMQNAGPLVCMVHLSDLLCRLRDLGYGYNEVLAVTFTDDCAWGQLAAGYPDLAKIDLVRFTLDIEGSMDQIAELVNSVFAPPRPSR